MNIKFGRSDIESKSNDHSHILLHSRKYSIIKDGGSRIERIDIIPKVNFNIF